MFSLVVFFLFGLCVGSFLNVCIYRIPNNISIISPRSFCPYCKKKIKWFENIPLLSFFLLKTYCSCKEKKISLLYPAVELLTAIFFVIIYFLYGISIDFVLLIYLFSALLVIFFIDTKHYIIPDIIVYPGIVIGIIKNFFPHNIEYFPKLADSIIGMIVGPAIILLIIFGYKTIRGKMGMGLGDAKFFALVGVWLGWSSIPFVIFSSSLLGAIYGVILIYTKGRSFKSAIPYGPFIIIGCFLYFLFGYRLTQHYFL